MSMPIDGFSATHVQQGEVEAGQAEIRRQVENVRRLGDSRLRQHAHANKVQQALKLIQPEQLLSVLQSANKSLQGASPQTVPTLDNDAPQLARPVLADSQPQQSSKMGEVNSQDEIYSTSGRLLGLMSKVTQLTSDTTLQNLIGQLKSHNSMLAGSSQMYNQLSYQLEQQATLWASDYDALKLAQQQADQLAQQGDAAHNQLTDAQRQLQALQAQAAQQQQTGELPPELQAQLTAAGQAVSTAQRALNEARAAYDSHLSNRLTPAIQAEKASKNLLEQTRQQAERLVNSLPTPQIATIDAQRKQQNEDNKSLTFLLAVISQLMSESASENLEASAVLKQRLAAAATKDAEKKAQEYDEQMRKADEMQQTMGCIGKIVGWSLVAISVAAAVVTGGSSLVLAGIGLALALGDEIYQAVTGQSFMEQALRPIMEGVVMPLVQALSKAATEVLALMGVSKENAAFWGQIIGGIAAAVVLIAGAFVAGKAVSKLGTMVMERVGQSVVLQSSKAAMKQMAAKMMDNSAGQLLKTMRQGMGRRLMNMSEVGLKRWEAYSQYSSIGINLANAPLQAYGAYQVADNLKNAEKARAHMLNGIALQEILNQMMDRMVEIFSHRMEAANAIITSMSKVAENQMQAGKYITRHMRAVAG